MRNLKVNTIVIATIAVALVVAGIPGTAEAGVCPKVGSSSGCVNSKDVKNNNLRATDLSDEAGADGSFTDFFTLTGGDDIVSSVTITAPTAGFVVVNTSGTATGAAVLKRFNCSLTTGSTLEGDRMFYDSSEIQTGFAMAEFFIVPAGSTTINLVCTRFLAATNLVDVFMTAIHTPTQY